MTNPKGTKEETRAVNWLIEHGWPFAKRLTKKGVRDEGDLSLGDRYPVTIESKARKTIDLAGFMRELEAEVANKGDDWGFVIIKKRGTTDPGEYYVTLPLKYLNMVLIRLYQGSGVVGQLRPPRVIRRRQ